MSSDLCARPATELAEMVRDRQISPVELVQAHLDRIAEREPALRAFQVVRRDEALREAAELADRTDLAELPLAGVPIAIKDNVAVAGSPTRMGSAATSSAPAEADDEMVRRLRAAGCVVIGKTQLPELAIWPFTEPAAYPATRNPHNAGRTPGGSTGGGAAAVAAGLAAIALGSDGGGSIRIPAACCGLFGIKPTPGAVPVAGGSAEHWLGLTAFGPITKTVADAAVSLDVLAGTARYRDPRPPDRPLRIGFSVRHPLRAKPTARASAALSDAAAILRNAGHSLVADSPAYPATLGLRFNALWLAGIAEDAAGLDAGALEPRTRQMARLGKHLAGRVHPTSRSRFARRAAAWFADYDVLMTPTLTRAAVPIGSWDGKGWFTTMLGVGNWLYTPAWNVAALPAASVPFGHDDDGLPLAVQLVGPAGSEGTLLSLAAQLEQLHPWPTAIVS